MAYFPYVIFVSVISFSDIRFVSYIVLKFVGASSKHLRVFLGSLRKLRKSSEIFGNFRKFSENVRDRSSGIRNNFGKSSEIFGRWSEIFGNHQKCRHQHVYIIKRTLHGGFEDVNFIFSWQKQYFTHSLRSFVKCFATRK